MFVRCCARALLILAWAIWLVGCGHAREGSSAPTDPARAQIIHVVSNGWHTGIIVPRTTLPDGIVPEARDFPKAAYLEFGWGDREYYPSPRPSWGTALAAALLPTASVVHVAGLDRPPRPEGKIEVLTLTVTDAGFERMIRAIDAAFDRDGAERAGAIAPGLLPDSHFYPAHGTFHLLNTCNTWIAEKLVAADVALSASGVVTADDLMERLRTATAAGAPSPSQQ